MRAAAKNFFIVPTLLSIWHLNAADTTKPDATQLYPFNNMDKALFYNEDTKKFESPYATASINTFPEDKLVIVEAEDLSKLYNYAMLRSTTISNCTLRRYKQLSEQKNIFRDYVKRVADTAVTLQEKLLSIQPTFRYPQHIALSQRDLMRVLQWSTGITIVWLMTSGSTGSHGDFFIEISLGKSSVIAAPLLHTFIMQAYDHVQEKKSRRFGETN